MAYNTIKVEFQESVCFLQIDRPEANNTINDELVAECGEVLNLCDELATVVVLTGSPEVFCFGADFKIIAGAQGDPRSRVWEPREELEGPEQLYDLWLRLASGPYVTISHVRGKANAGGLGFVAACDIVLAADNAVFSLSELLFGLYPACVLPFLIRRIGFQKAHYLTLMTKPMSAMQACVIGLVDECEASSDILLRRHLQRLRRLTKPAIRNYKTYMSHIGAPLHELRSRAVAANREMFSDAGNLHAIARYVDHGLFPWEKL